MVADDEGVGRLALNGMAAIEKVTFIASSLLSRLPSQAPGFTHVVQILDVVRLLFPRPPESNVR